jgi:hypothetical protein
VTDRHAATRSAAPAVTEGEVTPRPEIARPEIERLEIDGLEVDTEGGLGVQWGGRVDVDVRFTVSNTGDTTLHPTARVRVSSQIGGGVSSPVDGIRELAPGESTTVRERVEHVLPFGSVDAIITVRSEAPTVTASASTPVVPWFLLLAVTAVVVATVAILRHRRRREQAAGTGHG